MSILAVPVSNEKAMEDFLRLPYGIYQAEPNWVAPLKSEVRRTLDPDRNPYFNQASLQLFVCYKDGRPVSRLALIIDKFHLQKFGRRRAFFGYFESENDPEAVAALFRRAEEHIRFERMESLEGPFSPNYYSELGVQIDRFGTPPAFFQPFNPPYYRALLEKTGFRVEAAFQTMKNDAIGPYLEKRYGPVRGFQDHDGFIVRPFQPRDLEAELTRIRVVNNDAFEGNWHFLPLSAEEYVFSAKYLSLVTKPELIQIVEHRGRPAAVLHCVLDINPLLKRLKGRVSPAKYLRFMIGRRNVRNLIIFTVAIRKEYQHTIVYDLLLQAFRRLASSYRSVETTWLSPDNLPALRAAESLGMIPDKHFAIYEKTLGN